MVALPSIMPCPPVVRHVNTSKTDTPLTSRVSPSTSIHPLPHNTFESWSLRGRGSQGTIWLWRAGERRSPKAPKPLAQGRLLVQAEEADVSRSNGWIHGPVDLVMVMVMVGGPLCLST